MKDIFKNKRINDEDLEKISGGWGDDDDNTKCQWNPDGSRDHVLEQDADGIMKCKYCGVHFLQWG